MLSWFEKTAPIRVKFKALLVIQFALSVISIAAQWLALSGGGSLMFGTSVAVMMAMLVIIWTAGKLISGPYVNTVLRMEGLARGDTTSPIAYTDYQDCVGRMTKAMAVFRDNAEKVSLASDQQEQVVGALAHGLEKIAQGDLSYQIDKPFVGDYDRLRVSFNQAVAGLDESMRDVASSAASVHSGSSEIRGASEDLSRRTEQQAASLEESAAAMNQVTDMVAETARNATAVRGSIDAAHHDASEGGNVVGRAIEAMDAIEKSSSEISQIINVIDGIAFQTNLLALNAGVEAARAGDAGKGFAVVANEVRALAQRSADAAKDIKTLITTSSEQVSQGVALVGETGTMLRRIVTKIADVNLLVDGMATSAEKQAINIQQVNAAVADMDRMTQQNAAMVEETTAASRNLAGEADQLATLVARFNLSEHRAASRMLPAEAQATRSLALSSKLFGNLALKDIPQEDWTDF